MSIPSAQTEFTIQRGVPLPPRALKHRYPLAQMKVGDSIFVPAPVPSLRSYVSIWGRDHNMRFSTRRAKVGRKTGLRLWRIA